MAEQTPQRVWFITGASTGFGKEMTEQLLRAGHKVVATARKPEQIRNFEFHYKDRCLVLQLDVTSQEQVDAAAKAAVERFGRVDVLVNNAGYGLCGAIEEATEDEVRPMFETNVFGLVRMTKALLPQFRKQRSGNIVNLSSIAGLVATQGWGYYNASKFAVEGLSDALAAELAPLGVHVTTVEPGPFRTDFLGRSGQEAKERIADYDGTAGKTREYFHGQAGKQPGDPVKAVQAIIAAVQSPEPPRHLLLGKFAWERMSGRIDAWRKELDAQREVALAADYQQELAEGK